MFNLRSMLLKVMLAQLREISKTETGHVKKTRSVFQKISISRIATQTYIKVKNGVL